MVIDEQHEATLVEALRLLGEAKGLIERRPNPSDRRSVVIDLKRSEGTQAFLRLCESADVVVEAFSPGTMDRLGLSYAELSDRFPRLIYCSVPAYPPGHRFANRPGWEPQLPA